LSTGYHPRVALVGAGGSVLRYLPRATAAALTGAGVVRPREAVGRVREVELVQPASTHAERIGEPSTPSITGVRFTRWVRLDSSASRIVEHHPRATYEF